MMMSRAQMGTLQLGEVKGSVHSQSSQVRQAESWPVFLWLQNLFSQSTFQAFHLSRIYNTDQWKSSWHLTIGKWLSKQQCICLTESSMKSSTAHVLFVIEHGALHTVRTQQNKHFLDTLESRMTIPCAIKKDVKEFLMIRENIFKC